MLKRSLLACVFALAATPAFADLSSCYEPIPPAAIDGNTATEEQMQHALSDVKDFIKASDDYQTCVQSEYSRMKKEADNSKDKTPIDPSITADAKKRIDVNQKLKERIGTEFNTAVAVFKKKHP